MKRVTISMPEQLDREILGMRKEDAFIRDSYSEIVRKLLELGLRATKAQDQTA